jgi:hypothetical protein
LVFYLKTYKLIITVRYWNITQPLSADRTTKTIDRSVQCRVTSLNNHFVTSTVFGLTISLALSVEPRGPGSVYRGLIKLSHPPLAEGMIGCLYFYHFFLLITILFVFKLDGDK